jgi:hypothetical protein
MLAYNILRIIGQISLEGRLDTGFLLTGIKQLPKTNGTVMQDLIYMAGRLINSGRRWSFLLANQSGRIPVFPV